MRTLFLFTVVVSFAFPCLAAREKARDLGIPFPGVPGEFNAITDVPGVTVGHATIREGKPGEKIARTGVTVVFPRGNKTNEGVPAAWDSLNGNGDLTGTQWIEESGFLEGPVAMTNTASVGTVRDALIEWTHKTFPNSEEGLLPVIGETDDSWTNDLYGMNVRKQHVYEAIENAKGGQVQEGCYGAGTGVVAFQFKSGIGTSSRVTKNFYKVGALVQSNFGKRHELMISGVPVGKELENEFLPRLPKNRRDGSIIVVIATDAPLLPSQLKRMAKRVSLGIARTGGIGRNSSGDLFVAFSTVRPEKSEDGTLLWKSVPNDQMDELLEATVHATEEAIINALIAAFDTLGNDNTYFYSIPKDDLLKIMKKYNRFVE